MKRIRFTLVELLVVIAIIAILASLLLAAVNMAMIRAKKVAAKADALNLKSAIVMFQNDNQRLPDVTNNGAYGAYVDNAILTADQYKELVLILRGKEKVFGEVDADVDNKRLREYLPLARPFESVDNTQFKCKLVDGYKTNEAQFFVILDTAEDGISFDGGTINEPVFIFWSESGNASTRATIKETGVCTADLP